LAPFTGPVCQNLVCLLIRPARLAEEEHAGPDLSQHGEEGYDFNS
jgi:hypothetical protein